MSSQVEGGEGSQEFPLHLVNDDGGVQSAVGGNGVAGLLQGVSHDLNPLLLVVVHEGQGVKHGDTSR